MKKSISLFILLFSCVMVLAEGSKDVTPGTNTLGFTDINNDRNGALCAAGSGDNSYGRFLRSDRDISNGYSQDSRMYIYVKAGEQLHFGLGSSTESSLNMRFYYVNNPSGFTTTTSDQNSHNSNRYYNYSMSPNSNNATGTIDSYVQATAGPDVVNSSGYDAYSLPVSNTQDRLYWVVITSDLSDNVFIDRWDFTVTSGSGSNIQVHEGRLYSKAWIFDADNFNRYVSKDFKLFTAVPNDNDDAYYVKSMNYNGIQPYRWNVYANDEGTTTGSTIAEKRKSQNGNVGKPQYLIFVNDPDSSLWPSASISLFNPALSSTCNSNGGGEAVFSFEIQEPAEVNVLVDLNFNGTYESTLDRLFTVNYTTAGQKSITWDGKDATGSVVTSGAAFRVEVEAGIRVVHYPMYDVEDSPIGISIENVRPGNPGPEQLYWDDSNLSGSESGGTNLTGVYGPAHQFSNSDVRTHNTWSFGNIQNTSFSTVFEYTCYGDVDNDDDGIPNHLEGYDYGSGIVSPWDDSQTSGTPIYRNVSSSAIAAGLSADSNGDGINDYFDADLDGVPNFLDLDSDNDGITDIIEAGGADIDGNGKADDLTDTDNDGLVDLYDASSSNINAYNSTLFPTNAWVDNDADSDGVPNFYDVDADNDGILDVVEAGGTDTDNNGTVDNFADANNNGYHDIYDGLCNINVEGTGYAYAQTNSGAAEVSTPNNALGVPGSSYAELDVDDAYIDLQMLYYANSPQSVKLYYDGTSPGGSAGTFKVLQSPDGVAWATTSVTNQSSENGSSLTISVNATTKYIRVQKTNSSGYVQVQGLEYHFDETISSCGATSGGNPIITTGSENDTDDDLVFDWNDIDSDNDGVLDVTEAGGEDHNNDGRFSIDGTTTVAANGQVIHNNVLQYVVPDNADQDALPNHLDLDSDNDGMADARESGGMDGDNDGLYGMGTPNVNASGQVVVGSSVIASMPDDFDEDDFANPYDIDSDNDGIADIIEMQPTGAGYIAPTGDANNDGIDDAFAAGFLTSATNTDGAPDGPDYLDLDADNDGISDQRESGIAAAGNAGDADNDGLLDDYDIYNNNSNPSAATNSNNNNQTATSPFPTTAPNAGPQPNWRYDNRQIVSGQAWIDPNGLANNMYDGTQNGVVNGSQLYVNAIDDLGNIVASVAINNDGTFSISVASFPGGTTLQISATPGVVGEPSSSANLPAGYGSTAEGRGANGDDNTPDAEIVLLPADFSSSINDINFGIEMLPETAASTPSDVALPSGLNSFIIEATDITGTDADGTVTGIKLVEWPTHTDRVLVGTTAYYETTLPGTCPASYTCALFPAQGILIPADAAGSPTEIIRIDPTEGDITPGATTVDVKFAAIDDAGMQDATPAIFSQTFDTTTRTLEVVTNSYCATGDIPTLSILIKANFNPNGLTASVTWTSGTPDATLLPTSPVSPIVQNFYQSFTISGATLNTSTGNYEVTATEIWPGAAVVGGVGANWPGWVNDPGLGWVPREDGYSGYRFPDTKIEVQVNPTGLDPIVNYPPPSPTCVSEPPAIIAGKVWQDEDGSGDAAWAGIPNGAEAGTNAGGLFVYAIGQDPSDNNIVKVIAKSPVAADGTYSLTDCMRGTSLTVFATTDGSFAVGDAAAGLLATLPSGWGETSPVVRIGVDNTASNLDNVDLGIHQLPTSTNQTQASTLNTNSGVPVNLALFNGTDPDLTGGNDAALGGITKMRISSFPTGAETFTVDGTTYYNGTAPANCTGCVDFATQANGVDLMADANGNVSSTMSVKPSILDGDIVISYVAVDVAGGENETPATLTIPVEVIKWNGTAWENGFGPDGIQGTSDDGPVGPGDGANTVYILNETTGNAPTTALVEESAIIGNLIFADDVNGNPHGLDINAIISNGVPGNGACLTINGVVENQGYVRMLARSESEYGQYLGPELTNATFQMVLNESGWHNMAFPMSNVTATQLATENNQSGSQNAVNLTNVESTHNLWWYDSKESGGKEQGFFIDRTAPGVAAVTAYNSHAYGTWKMVDGAEILNTHGYNYFVDDVNNVSALPFTMNVSGATNHEAKTFATHNNFGGWNLVPNIYPVTIDLEEMNAQGFFDVDIDKAVWIWNPGDTWQSPLQTGSFSSGAYVAYDPENNINVSIDPTNNVQASSSLIAPMQSFYVRRTSASTVRRNDGGFLDNASNNPLVASGSTTDNTVTAAPLDIEIKPSYRAACTSVKHYKTNAINDLILFGVRDLNNNSLTDASELAFGTHYTNGLDQSYDVRKNSSNSNGAPNVFSILENEAMLINKMSYPELNTQVPVGFYSTNKKGTYEFVITESPMGWSIYLEDKLTGVWHDMNLGAYNFTNEVDFRIDRFVLHFNKTGEAIAAVHPEVLAWGTQAGIEVLMNNMQSQNAEIMVTNLLGQVLHSNKNVSTQNAYFIPVSKSELSVYLVRIITPELTETIKVIR